MKLSEKTLKVASDVYPLAYRSRRALVTVHQNPDADAIGSALAFASLLDQFGTNVTVWAEDELDDYLQVLPGVHRVVRQFDTDEYDLIWVLDNTAIRRVRGGEKLDPYIGKIPLINIDHHADNTQYGDHNIVEDISSVGELITILSQVWNMGLSMDAAVCLYAAIAFDTGRFLYSNTTANTFEAASYLVRCGVDPGVWGTRLFETIPAAAFETLAVALARLRVDRARRFAYTTLPLGSGPDLIKPIDTIRQIKEADVFAVFREEMDNVVRINLRSKGTREVHTIAHEFGGGGHPKAAGITYSGSLDSAVNDIVTAVNRVIDHTDVA